MNGKNKLLSSNQIFELLIVWIYFVYESFAREMYCFVRAGEKKKRAETWLLAIRGECALCMSNSH